MPEMEPGVEQPAIDERDTFLRRFFAALSDEQRLAVVGLLAVRPATAAQLAELLSLREADLGRHLSVLAEAGIVRRQEESDPPRYVLDVAMLRAQRQALLRRPAPQAPGSTEGTPEWERTVLATFFDGERLQEIPAQQRKRLVILRWLAERFEVGRRYPEREVNAILAQHHPDVATLRRALVDYRFLLRESGIYWRA